MTTYGKIKMLKISGKIKNVAHRQVVTEMSA